MIYRWVRSALALVGLMMATNMTSTTRGGDEPVKKPADALPEVEQLPNPFVFLDGSPVLTPADWSRRRDELKALFQAYEYGQLPPNTTIAFNQGGFEPRVL